jgi:hypothetical protein
MWSVFEGDDKFLITTNSTVKRNGALVMGRGIALQAKTRFPGLDLALGQAILRVCPNQGRYGLIVGRKLGIFQVKYHYAAPADLELIRYSTGMLTAYAAEHPDIRIHLNYPGIGWGHLSQEQVAPIILALPDNVFVWSFR